MIVIQYKLRWTGLIATANCCGCCSNFVPKSIKDDFMKEIYHTIMFNCWCCFKCRYQNLYELLRGSNKELVLNILSNNLICRWTDFTSLKQLIALFPETDRAFSINLICKFANIALQDNANNWDDVWDIILLMTKGIEENLGIYDVELYDKVIDGNEKLDAFLLVRIDCLQFCEKDLLNRELLRRQTSTPKIQRKNFCSKNISIPKVQVRAIS